MKRAVLILTIILGFAGESWGDRNSIITVVSFEMNSTDMEAMTNRITDDSGDLTALIKIETSARGFSFDCGSMGVVEVDENHPGEIWVYVQQSASKITISHNDWGILRDFKFPTGDLIEGRTYVMKIATDRAEIDDATLVQSQFLEIQAYPHDAMVEIDGEHVELTDNGVASKWVSIGKHRYKVSAKGFRTMPGVADVNDVHKKTIVSVRLQPAVGYLKVEDTGDYSGASVYVDNSKVGTLPMDSIMLESGTHKVRVSKRMYKPFLAEVMVEDGNIAIVSPKMQQNYAVLEIRTEYDAEIWANGEYLGIGTWQGKLESGYTVLESRKNGHRTTEHIVELGIGTVPDIEIAAPQPAYGKLTVTTNLKGATVLVDNKKIGHTPLTNAPVMIGKRRIAVEKNGYQTLSDELEIAEGTCTSFDKEMTKAYPVNIECDIPAAEWWIDDQYFGVGKKQKLWLGAGHHLIKITASGYDDIVTAMNVDKGQNSYAFRMTEIMPDTIIYNVNGADFKMIRIKGGYFEMGNNNGNKIETPQHIVALNSYYISETEVTQKQWMAVTGITIESLMAGIDYSLENVQIIGKGDNLPMYFVNWYDCQYFLKLLNESTGQTFQLPTEAQWEYAARGGCHGGDELESEIWCMENSNAKCHAVAAGNPNRLGLYNMLGNVGEWCRDWIGDYPSGMQINPTGTKIGTQNVVRGGSWFNYRIVCRPTLRMSAEPTVRSNKIGFRLVIEIGKKKK